MRFSRGEAAPQRERDLLAGVSAAAGLRAVRRRGSHVRITTQVNGEHHEVVPLHSAIKAETLSSILKSVGRHHGMSVEELLQLLGS